MARSGAPGGVVRRVLNAAIMAALRRGVGPPGIFLLETRGRRSGTVRTTPVSLVDDGTARYLVSPYGETGWVRNARAAGEVGLRRGSRVETLPIAELAADAAGPVLKRYTQEQRVVRPWFDARPDAPAADFATEADRHPVFRLG